MGCESVQVILTNSSILNEEIFAYLDNMQNIERDFTEIFYNTPYEYNYIFNDLKHLIEIQLTTYQDNHIQLSCRFSLCHPASIDDVFIDMTETIARDLELTIKIMESCSSDIIDKVFSPIDLVSYKASLKRVMQIKREYWISDFGKETAVIDCQEAIKRYILPKCK